MITEVTLKVRPLPVVQRYGSIVFPDFTRGVNCMREVALHRCQPASIRLMDNEQFKFGGFDFPVLTDVLKSFIELFTEKSVFGYI